MKSHPEILEEELHAFIDGELDPVRAAEVAQTIASDAALAGKIAAYRSDQDRLHNVFAAVSDQPLPQAWLNLIESKTESHRTAASVVAFRRPAASSWRSLLPAKGSFTRTAALLAASTVLAVGSWFAYERVAPSQEDSIVAEANSARTEKLGAGQTFAAADLSAPEQRDEAITAALTMPLKVPDLEKLGFQFANMYVYTDVPGGKAVELAYRDNENRLFTLYVRRPTGPARVDMSEQNGLWTCIWQDDVVGTVMQGEMSAAEMARLASLAYNGLYF